MLPLGGGAIRPDNGAQPSSFVVGIGGTKRPGSTTERALRRCLEAAAARGAGTALFGADALAQLPSYESGVEPIGPVASQLLAAVRRATGIFIASPGYHAGVSGLVKNALDHLEALRDDDPAYLDGRAVGCIACAYGWQASVVTLTALRSIVHALRGWPTPIGVAMNSSDERAVGATEDRLVSMAGQVMDFAQGWGRVPQQVSP